MTAVCRVVTQSTATSKPGFDTSTGRSVYPEAAIIYGGPCRITASPAVDRAPDVGDRATPEADAVLAVPLAAPHLPVGATVLIDDADDHTLAGTRLTIVGAQDSGLAWQRTYLCTGWTTTVR